MKTIKQIADELGVSKQAVAKRMKKEPLATELIPFVETTTNGKLILDEGVALIYSDFKNNRQPTVSANGSPTPTNQVVDILQEQISFLQGQLTVKDEQLSEKDKQIEFLQNAFKNEQALHAGTIQKQLDSSNENDIPTVEDDEPNVEALADERDAKPPKRGFWGLFNKKNTPL